MPGAETTIFMTLKRIEAEQKRLKEGQTALMRTVSVLFVRVMVTERILRERLGLTEAEIESAVTEALKKYRNPIETEGEPTRGLLARLWNRLTRWARRGDQPTSESCTQTPPTESAPDPPPVQQSAASAEPVGRTA